MLLTVKTYKLQVEKFDFKKMCEFQSTVRYSDTHLLWRSQRQIQDNQKTDAGFKASSRRSLPVEITKADPGQSEN